MKYESQYYGVVQMEDIIEHHGIKGMKWGIRRYQNKDGTLTPAGMKRYNTSRAGKPGKSVMTRHTAKMYEKYGLLEPNPSKDQAWDNVFDMVSKGATRDEIKKYLKDTKVPIKDLDESDIRKAVAKKAAADAKAAYHVEENAKRLSKSYQDFQEADKALSAHFDSFTSKIGTKEFEEYFERGLKNRISDDAEELRDLCRQELKEYMNGSWKVKPSSVGGVDFAYDEYNIDHPKEYGKLVDAWREKRDAFDEKCSSVARREYKAVGKKPMVNWGKSEGNSKNNDKDNIDVIDYMIYNQCRKLYEEEKKR